MHSHRRRLLLMAIIMLACSGTSTGQNQDAVAAMVRGDYAAALRLWQPMAEQGNAFAQYSLGWMYSNGKGVPQNYTQAVKWLRLAAGNGDANGQYNLGLMYANGRGVPKD